MTRMLEPQTCPIYRGTTRIYPPLEEVNPSVNCCMHHLQHWESPSTTILLPNKIKTSRHYPHQAPTCVKEHISIVSSWLS